MNIILEGPDAVGKTTVANNIVLNYGYNYAHIKEQNCSANFYLNLLSNKNFIFDRFYLSELVFPKIYKRDSILTFDDYIQVSHRIVDNNDLLVIIFSSDLDILSKRFKDRNEEEYLNEVKQQYEEFLKWIYVSNAYFDQYPNYRVIDIADKNGYDKLDSWLNERLN